MAIMRFKSLTRWTGEGLSCESDSRGFKVVLDEPENLGGKNAGMNPVELLLSSLGGCMSICAAAFAEQCDVELKGFSVDIEGDLDPDGFLGIKRKTKKGYQEIRYRMNIDSPSSEVNIERLKAMIEERCPVSDTLKGVMVKSAVA